jgi:hypothetical protein
MSKQIINKVKKDTGVTLNRIGETVAIMGLVFGTNIIINDVNKRWGVVIFIMSFLFYLILEEK